MSEDDAQTAVGDAIEAATANAIAARNHAYVEKLAAGSGARGTLAAQQSSSGIMDKPLRKLLKPTTHTERTIILL